MEIKVTAKEADSIIRSLEAGVVPQKGIRHLLVGRKEEVGEVIRILDNTEKGESDARFWGGDYGSGKSFMLRMIESLAIQKNFVVSTVDLTQDRRFYASDGKAKALYTEVIDNLITPTSQNGNALNSIFEEWINEIAVELAEENSLSVVEIFSKDNENILKNKIIDITNSFKSVGLSYELGQAIFRFYQGTIEEDKELQLKALRWIRGDMETVTEAKRELGINKIINDDNWFLIIRNLSELFSSLGYSGFVINFDEMVNLYKLTRKQTREKNYEKILNLYNECKQGKTKHLFLNFGATRKTVYDKERGMASYGALQTRLGEESELDSQFVNTDRTVLPLKVLNNEEIYTLLKNVNNIYNVHYKKDIELSESEIQIYMEKQLNTLGAEDRLTPRNVIKDFILILNILRQNPSADFETILNEKFGEIHNYLDGEDEDSVVVW